MAYEVILLGHLHMPLYFLGTFTEYPYEDDFLIAMYVKSDLLHQLTPSSSIIPFY